MLPPREAGPAGRRRGHRCQQAEAYQDIYIPISAQAGRLLYALVRAIRPETVVEFGTSFGISTIYLAAAVTDNGAGHIYTTELSSKKVGRRRRTLPRPALPSRSRSWPATPCTR